MAGSYYYGNNNYSDKALSVDELRARGWLKSGTSRTTTTPTKANINAPTKATVAPTTTKTTTPIATNNYSFPYESQLKSLVNSMSGYTTPSQSTLSSQAQRYANLQIDPQVTALQNALEQAKNSYTAQKASTEANYAGYQDAINRQLDTVASKALESAIARGGGRSGAVEWLTAEQQKPILETSAQTAAQKEAALNAIAQALSTYENQYSTNLSNLETQRGQLSAQQLGNLNQQAYSNSAASIQQQLAALQGLAGMATQANQFNQNMALQQLPYYSLTEQQRQALPLEWTQAIGQVPGNSNTSIGLRDYATSKGASIDYDANTGEVLVNGKRYSSGTLQNLGGQLINDRWYLPESAVNALMG